jgi:phage tail-like protein
VAGKKKVQEVNQPVLENLSTPQKTLVMPDLRGKHIIDATRTLRQIGLSVGTVKYDEFKCPVLHVFEQGAKPYEPVEEGAVVDLKVASANPIRNLPSIYQGNQSLKNFLWIFQHITNDIQATLDRVHTFFDPIEAPTDFYKWLGSWFSINVNYAITEEKMRCLIRDAVNLYQWRGTVVGLTKYLEIITDVKPTIHENVMPQTEFIIDGNRIAERQILDESTSQYFFTVEFPVGVEHFSLDDIKKIYYIIQTEKPAHTNFYLIFTRVKKERKVSFFEIGTNTIDGISQI